jgi:hypothetical protein
VGPLKQSDIRRSHQRARLTYKVMEPFVNRGRSWQMESAMSTKNDAATESNTQKDPDDWVSGDEWSTGVLFENTVRAGALCRRVQRRSYQV